MEESVQYSIHDCSSYSGDFTPDHVLVDNPTDAKSRWLSDGNKPPQFLTLRLSQPVILCSIVFGKWDKSHPCNLRKFRVYGGMDCEHMQLLLESGLKNDSEAESFSLSGEVSTEQKQPFPCQFVKIVPLVSWGYSSNFSVWYVSLTGVQDKGLIHEALEHFSKCRERQAVRLCLKHLRQFDFPEAFEALHKKAKVDLEHPLLAQLYSLLVERGDFEGVERAVKQAVEDGFMDVYISQQPIEAQWTQIATRWRESLEVVRPGGLRHHRVGPGMRGGHQICIDPIAELLYLYGGWDGSCDLGDLWKFDIRATQWECLCQDSSSVGGPSPRSCHKMCIDVANQKLYLLGRYVDTLTRTQLDLTMQTPGDFYSYCLHTKCWELISLDTFADGGPHLIYDHQMCFDPHTCILYIFGGRILSNGLDAGQLSYMYSGLYAYHCTDKHWTCLRPDLGSSSYQYSLVPRMAHSMLYHPEQRKLYVLGGQRDRQPLSDMLVYNLASDDTTVIADGRDSHIPASGFTVRTTLDPQRNEIHLLTGLHKSSEDSHDESRIGTNTLWVCDCAAFKWSCISQTPPGSWLKAEGSHLPPPRYAHQFVYDPLHQVHYMFGGNPGNDTSSSKRQQNMRLDDFWRLKLVRASKEQLLRHCQYIIKKLRFGELAARDPVAALSFLQSELAAIVNHDDEQESTEFRQLASSLFSQPSPPSPPSPSSSSTTAAAAARGDSALSKSRRSEVYQELSSYFPEDMTQPRDSIIDMVKL